MPTHRNQDESNRIIDPRKDPLGAMLLDYLNGRTDAFVEVDSPNLEMWRMEGRIMFRDYQEMDDLEKTALNLAYGKILDAGAGSGCHALYLQRRGAEVDACDISPGCVQVMLARGVQNVFHRSLFAVTERKYETILMLMNGLGLCGSLDGCNLFLQFVQTILTEGGQVLAESTAVEADDDKQESGQEGLWDTVCETEFSMRYGDIVSDPFPWLYLDFNTLARLARFHGLRCEQLAGLSDGRYLARICC